MNYNDFKFNCETFAKYHDCMIEVKYYDLSAYGMNDWWNACFMIDRFGGNACEIAFINDNFRFTDFSGSRICSRLSECFELAIPAVEFEQAHRHLDRADMVNID